VFVTETVCAWCALPQMHTAVERGTSAVADARPGRAAGFGTERWCADPLVASARHATAAILTAAAVFVTETVCAWCALPQMQTCV